MIREESDYPTVSPAQQNLWYLLTNWLSHLGGGACATAGVLDALNAPNP